MLLLPHKPCPPKKKSVGPRPWDPRLQIPHSRRFPLPKSPNQPIISPIISPIILATQMVSRIVKQKDMTSLWSCGDRRLAATCTSRDTSSRRPGRRLPISAPPWDRWGAPQVSQLWPCWFQCGSFGFPVGWSQDVVVGGWSPPQTEKCLKPPVMFCTVLTISRLDQNT